MTVVKLQTKRLSSNQTPQTKMMHCVNKRIRIGELKSQLSGKFSVVSQLSEGLDEGSGISVTSPAHFRRFLSYR